MVMLSLRQPSSPRASLASALLASAVGLVACALLIAFGTPRPDAASYAFFIAPVTTAAGLSGLAVEGSPLLLGAVGFALCLRAGLWNLGLEGQLVMGAMMGTFAAISLPEIQGAVLLPTLLLGVIGGALWAAIPALLRAQYRVDELLTSLLMSYIALLILSFLTHTPLLSAGAIPPSMAQPLSNALLPPLLPDRALPLSLLFAAIALLLFAGLLHFTLLGYQLRVSGQSVAAARFSGINARHLTWFSFLTSGGLAGLAGIVEVTGHYGRLIPELAPGFTFAVVTIALLGRQQPVGLLLATPLVALIELGSAEGSAPLPTAAGDLVLGLMLLAQLAFDWLLRRAPQRCQSQGSACKLDITIDQERRWGA